jgi:microcystin-dependent protein
MTTDSFTGTEMEYPPGAIMLWHSSDVPPGWVFCDGNNGTANLENRYPKCVPNGSTDPGGTGGQHNYSLSVSQLPSHTHSVYSISTSGSHSHKMTSAGEVDLQNNGADADVWGTNGSSHSASNNFSHSHSFSVSNTGSNNNVDNEPNYREARFIQKL